MARRTERGIRTARTACVLVAAVAALAMATPPGVPAHATPKPFRVGGVADLELFRGAEIGARARLDALNAAGGIDGRMVEFLGVSDDTRDPTAARAETRRLVREIGVDAVVPVMTSRFTDDGTLADAKVPAFGWGIAGGFCGNRWAFAFTGCRAPLLPRRVPDVWGELVASVLQTRGVTRPSAAIVTERAAVPRALDELEAVVEAAGVRVVYAEAALGTGEDATSGVDAVADAILGSGAAVPSAVFAVAGFAAVGALQDALRARQYGGVMTNLVQYAPALTQRANGAYVLTEFATPESASDNEAMREIVAQIATVTSEAVTQSMLGGWFAADFWVRAVRAAGPEPSSARVARVASRMRYRIPGTVGPTPYPAAFVRPTPCGQLVTSDGSAFSVAVPYRCTGYVRVG